MTLYLSLTMSSQVRQNDKDLRKRRRLNKDQVTPAAVALSEERYLESFVDGVSKKEYFLFHNLPWPRASKEPQLLSLSQGKFLIEQRLKDLHFVKSGGETPGDGNCLMHCLCDQMRYEDRLKDWADSHQSLRWKIVNYGYDMFIKTGVLTWVAPETPLNWKNRMMKDGCWGDDVFLQLTSNILEVDLVIVPAFKETAVHQGLGFTLVTSFKKPSHGPLYLFHYSESDFASPHYQSIRPKSVENVFKTYLEENQRTIDEARSPVLQESGSESRLELPDGSLMSDISSLQVVVVDSFTDQR